MSSFNGSQVRYRRLGCTGLATSEIGYGTWGMGGDAWKGGSDEEALAALRRSIELGVNFLDTAQDVRGTFSTGQFPDAVLQALQGLAGGKPLREFATRHTDALGQSENRSRMQ